MELQPGTTYRIAHKQYKELEYFITCLGKMSHVSIYNNHDDYYRNTKDLERVFNKNGFEITEIQV